MRPKDDLWRTRFQGQWYSYIDLGKLLKNLNSKKKASMYLLNRKAMIPFLESTDWCVCKFSSKQRRVREATKDLMQDLSTACNAGCSLGCHRFFLSDFWFWSITRNEILCYRCWKYQRILTNSVHGSQSRIMYPYLMKQDFFHLRIITQKQLTAAILLLVCNDMGFFSGFWEKYT